jgi:ribosomal protein S27AE
VSLWTPISLFAHSGTNPKFTSTHLLHCIWSLWHWNLSRVHCEITRVNRCRTEETLGIVSVSTVSNLTYFFKQCVSNFLTPHNDRTKWCGKCMRMSFVNWGRYDVMFRIAKSEVRKIVLPLSLDDNSCVLQ